MCVCVNIYIKERKHQINSRCYYQIDFSLESNSNEAILEGVWPGFLVRSWGASCLGFKWEDVVHEKIKVLA